MASKGTDRKRGRGRLIAGLMACCTASAGPAAASAETVTLRCWEGDRPTGYLEVRADSASHRVEFQSYPDVTVAWVLLRDGSQNFNICPEPSHCTFTKAKDLEPVLQIWPKFKQAVGPKATVIPVWHAELTDTTIKAGFAVQVTTPRSVKDDLPADDYVISIDLLIDRQSGALMITDPQLAAGPVGQPRQALPLRGGWEDAAAMIKNLDDEFHERGLLCHLNYPEKLYPPPAPSNFQPVQGDPGLTRQGK